MNREKEYSAAIKEKGYREAAKLEVASNAVFRPYSKTENKGIQFYTLKEKVAEMQQEIAQITDFINNSGLTEQEKQIMWLVANNQSLSKYARENEIQPSNVYKIRDRALRKIGKTQKQLKKPLNNSKRNSKTG